MIVFLVMDHGIKNKVRLLLCLTAGNRLLSDSTQPRPVLLLAGEPRLTGIPVNQSPTSPQQPVSCR